LQARGGQRFERSEDLSGPTGRRTWLDAVKARIAADPFEASALAVDVAQLGRVPVRGEGAPAFGAVPSWVRRPVQAT
jgi:hypothetical protein